MPKADPLFDLLAEGCRQDDKSKEIGDQRKDLLSVWSADPWAWLVGRDVDDRPIIWTSDEKSAEEPIRPYPDKAYLRAYVNDLYAGYMERSDHATVILVEKARQMIITWTTLLFFDWLARFRPARRFVICKTQEDEAKRLLREKVREMHKHLPAWLALEHPASTNPLDRCDYLRTGSSITAGGENVAEREARGGSCSGMLIDEAVEQHNLLVTVAAALPMVRLLVLVGTPNLAGPGGESFKRLLERKDL